MADKNTVNSWSKKARFGVIGVALVLMIGTVFIVFHPGYETTNDAQIQGHIHPINARIGGTIIWVNPEVEDTHFVRAGTVLARLDANDYQPIVDRLRGDVQSNMAQWKSSEDNVPIVTASATSRLSAAAAGVRDAQSEVSAAQAQYKAADASVRQTAALYERAEHDRLRYQALVSTHDISRSEYEQRATDAQSLQEQLDAAKANLQAADQRRISAKEKLAQRQSDLASAETRPQQIAVAKSEVDRAKADLERSRASLRTAELDLSYTSIIAPVDGVIGRRSMEVGLRVSQGQLLLTLVPPKDVWAVANFRETQLRHMRIGQEAKIHVDSYDYDIRGLVESFGGATGSQYSLIAPDNATGNFVKVVQRVPVRIRLEQLKENAKPLLPGMSVEVRVRTHVR